VLVDKHTYLFTRQTHNW